MPPNLPPATVSRLVLLRRFLSDQLADGVAYAFSYEIAHYVHATAATVRRDLMSIGCAGNPARGYSVEDLLSRTVELLESCAVQRAVLVGIGNLGRALLSYVPGRVPGITIVAAFDSNPQRVDRVVSGCRTYPTSELSRIAAAQQISVGIIAVPAAAAQDVADLLIAAGVEAIFNCAPVGLRVPDGMHVEHMDVMMYLERAAYYACRAAMSGTRSRAYETNRSDSGRARFHARWPDTDPPGSAGGTRLPVA